MHGGHGLAPVLAALLLRGAAVAEEPPSAGRSFAVSFMAGQGFLQQPGHGFSEFASAVVSAGVPRSRHLELRLEVYPVFLVRQPRVTADGARETVGAVAADIGLRWFARPPGSHASPYVELLAGPLYGFRHIPEPGSAFNFLLQLAGGAILPVGSRAHLVAAYRWVHISNAGTSRYNPSWNYSTFEFGSRWEYP
ncbi:MAG: acyloxyacyl hydrolase [Thermoanaerobaculia bacterium]